MNLWSSLNGNLGKAPEQAAAVDMDKNRVKGPGSDLLVDPTDLGKISKRPIFLTVVAAGVAVFFVFNIILKMTAKDTPDAFAITVMNNGAEVELYEHTMKANAYADGEWIYEEAPSVRDSLAEIAAQMPVVEWNETFEVVVSEGAKSKWFDLYDENLTCIRYLANETEVNEFFSDAEPGTYYVLAGARWEGRYVLKSFTNESFTKEFCAAVVKE